MTHGDTLVPPHTLRVGDRIRLDGGDYALIVEKHGVEQVRCLCDEPCFHRPAQCVRLTIEHLPGTPFARRQEMKVWGTRRVTVFTAGS